MFEGSVSASVSEFAGVHGGYVSVSIFVVDFHSHFLSVGWTLLEGSAQKLRQLFYLRSLPDLLIYGPKWPKKHSPGFTLGYFSPTRVSPEGAVRYGRFDWQSDAVRIPVSLAL